MRAFLRFRTRSISRQMPAYLIFRIKYIECQTDCAECHCTELGNQVCDECQILSYLYQGTCVKSCPLEFYGANGNCIRCPFQCTACFGPSLSQCTGCYSKLGYILSRGMGCAKIVCGTDEYPEGGACKSILFLIMSSLPHYRM